MCIEEEKDGKTFNVGRIFSTLALKPISSKTQLITSNKTVKPQRNAFLPAFFASSSIDLSLTIQSPEMAFGFVRRSLSANVWFASDELSILSGPMHLSNGKLDRRAGGRRKSKTIWCSAWVSSRTILFVK